MGFSIDSTPGPSEVRESLQDSADLRTLHEMTPNSRRPEFIKTQGKSFAWRCQVAYDHQPDST